MLDLVDERWYDPAAQDTGHCGRDHDDSNFHRVVGESVQGDLRRERDDSLPDHARDEEDDQVHGELAEHGEELEREDGVLGLGEVVPEAAHEDDGTDGDCRGNERDRVASVPEVRHAHEEDAETSGEEGEADKVELLELVPSRFLEIMLRAGRWEVADEGTGDAYHSVDDGDVKAPSPCRLDQELGCEVHAETAPRDVDAEFGPTETNSSTGRQYSCHTDIKVRCTENQRTDTCWGATLKFQGTRRIWCQRRIH